MMRSRFSRLGGWLLAAGLVACSSDDAADPGGGAGQSGSGGSGQSGAAGKAGAAGQAGKGGGAGASGSGLSGASGQAGSAGQAGFAGQAGASGQAGAGGAGAAGAGAAGAGAGGGGGAAGSGGSGQGGEAGQGGAGGSAGSAAGSGGAGSGGASGGAGSPACEPGCQGVCVAGVCCDLDRLCGGGCCAEGTVCSFEQCIQPGQVCTDGGDCGADEYCDPRFGTKSEGCPGVEVSQGKCLPRPPVCPGGLPPAPGEALTCVGKCEVKPSADDFKPTLKYTWGGVTTPPYDTDVMVTPVVIQLDDDNCDGKINERDTPEIAFTVYKEQQYFGDASLVVISIKDGKVVERWRGQHIYMDGQIAAGDIDGVAGNNEIVGCHTDGTVTAFHGESGEVMWKSPPVYCAVPTIADLDQDGEAEVIVEGGILSGKDGTLKHAFSTPMIGTFVVSDLDGDGLLDIISASQAYHGDGVLFASTGAYGYSYPSVRTIPAGPAVADLDGDGKPEVIGGYFIQHQIALWRHDPSAPGGAQIIRGGVDINGPLNPALCPGGSNGNLHGGGPLTVGDFNADGTPDVALAGGVGYAVFDGKKLVDPAVADADTFLWAKQTQDCSSAGTGSSLFDFNGDGKAEVVYADERSLRIYEGATGNELFKTCNTSGTLSEYPVIADVDGDDQADIVVVSNAFGAVYGSAYQCDDGSMTAGVRVYGSATGSWVRTRRIWNQHSYHVTNVNDDGSIPQVEAPNWKQPGLNNFRQNKQPGGEFSAPDAVVSLLAPKCSDGPFALVATVRNVGEAPLPAGVAVSFYAGEGASSVLLGVAKTTQVLYPAQGEDVVFEVPGGGASISSGQEKVHAVIDDGQPPHAWKECVTDNNSSVSTLAACGKL